MKKLGQQIADYLNPDGLFTDEDRARRRGLHMGPQGPDGMSRLNGLIDPEARAYFEAIEAAVRPGRHQPDGADNQPEQRDSRTPAQRCHDAFKLGMESAIASGRLGVHRGHPVTVIVTTTLAELNQAAHAAIDPAVPMPAPAGPAVALDCRCRIYSHGRQSYSLPGGVRRPHRAPAIPGPAETPCHR